ncbi:acyltransferase family protein [Leptothoe sp. PORK10 BA2]|uniref:acyltransferase family protein n=1 Tax=Leptothoe sp. PORK10 BA2 TaxID=3110254 RepID=UPI002B1E9697|nr:acyltransferase family protein [Leptothoe sp. PORK10 BA2]MEA5466705.1 acyltransferase family protein [Leptothoe sp. PORK10 BA2]
MLSTTTVPVSDHSTDQLKPSSQSKRFPWLDMAKAYGIFLVYYGHFVEEILEYKEFAVETAAYQQYKCIYAFHMPLFFMLSGFVYKHKEQPLGSFLYQKVLTRIVPALFFNILALGIYFLDHLVRGNNGFAENYSVPSILVDVLTGYPFSNFITWFLFCLFTVELLNHSVYPFIKDNLWKSVGLAILTLLVGYYLVGLNQTLKSSLPLRGLDTWYLNSSLIGLSFYQLGFILKQSNIVAWFEQPLHKYVGLVITLVATVTTFNLNQGPFLDPRGIVALAVTSYGNLFLFVTTAIIGSLFIILLSLSLPSVKGVVFFGKNTLILLGMNFLYVNIATPIIGKLDPSIFESWVTVTLFTLGLTLVSFLVNVPIIQLINRLVPQLMGKPEAKGPLLPALLR